MKNKIIGWISAQIRTVPVIIGICALAAMLLVYAQVAWWYHSYLITEKRSQAEVLLAPNGDNLNNALHRRLSLISGLEAYIQSYLSIGEDFTASQFEPFSRALYASISGIKRISVAPRGVIAYEFPKNMPDSAIGLDLILVDNPLASDSISKSITTRKVVLSRPSPLEHASIILTARKAVFDENGLWGFIIIEFDLIQIISESEMNLPQSGLAWALFDGGNDLFFGDPNIVKENTVEYKISMPDEAWFLRAAPVKGWEESIREDLLRFQAVSLVLIGLLTILAYLLADQQSRLSGMVKVRTTALENELALRAATERRLVINEEKFHSVFNQMSDIAVLYHLVSGGLPGAILEVNDAACGLLGFTRNEMMGLNLVDLESPQGPAGLLQQQNAVSLPGRTFYETEFLMKSGEILPVEIRFSHFSMQDKEVGLIIARDITERKAAEKDLLRANRALKVLTEFNESLVRARSESELLQVLCRILVNTGQYNLAWAGFFQGGGRRITGRVIERSRDSRLLTPPGEEDLQILPHICDDSVTLPLTLEGQTIGAMGIVLGEGNRFSDEENNLLSKLADDLSFGIHSLRLMAEASEKSAQLLESEALYHSLARNIPNGVVMLFDRQRRHILADGLGLAEFGLDPEDVAGKMAGEIFPQEICDSLDSQYEAALAGKSISQEFHIHEQVFEMHSSPIRNDRGDVIMGLNLIQNITEHKEMQKTIERQQEETLTILNSIPALIYFKTPDGRITWGNKTYQEFVSRSGEPLPESARKKKAHPNTSGFLSQGDELVFASGRPEVNIIEQVIRGDAAYWFTTDKIPLLTPDGGLEGFIGVSFDVTALKNAEREISTLNQELEARVARRTAELEEKNKELETFSYSVSHDLKAPLRGISGYSQLLQENYSHALDSEGKRFLNTIIESVKRMDQLINDLLSYSRMERRVLSRRELDIREMFQSVLDEFQDEIEARKILVEVSYGFTRLVTDGEGLVQILRNLIGNAVKFTRNQDSPTIWITTEESQDSWTISIRDNGIGLDMAYREKIFEIFQRLQSQEEYPGTGVGLAIVRKAVARLGGSVRVESEKGKGATFLVEILKGAHESDKNSDPD